MAAAGGRYVGGAVAPEQPDPELQTVCVVSDEAPVTADGKMIATVRKHGRFGVLSRMAAGVQIQVCRDTDIRQGWVDARHVVDLPDKDIALGYEAVRMTKVLKPKIDLKGYVDRFYGLVAHLAAAASEGTTPRDQVRLIGLQLFQRDGFRVPRGGFFTNDYYAANAMDSVLDRRVGACLSFSIVYLATARKLGLPMRMVMIPGHVAVRYNDGKDHFYVETTEKGQIYNDDKYLYGLMRIALPGGYRGIRPQVLPAARAAGVLLQHMATALSVAGRHRQAGHAFARTLEINPHSVEGYLNWGIYLDSARRHQDACRMYATCAELAPECPYAHFCWAGALVAMGKLDGASAKLAKAYELSPVFSPAYERRAMVLARLGKLAEACRMYAKVSELRPNHAPNYDLWASALLSIGQPEKACEVCAKAAEIAPRNSRIRCHWGRALGMRNRFVEACEQFEMAVKLDPEYADACYGWGVALVMTGKTAEAKEKLDQAVKLDPRLKPQVDPVLRKLGP